MRRLAVLLAALAACAVAAPSAFAHAALLRTAPADRQVLASAPAEVRLSFSEPIRPLGGMRAVDRNGRSVLRGKPRAAGRELVVPLARIGDGDYTVLWRVLSDDGHLETGVLAFRVGNGRGPVVPSLSAGGTITARDLVSRFLVFLGLLVVAGTAAFRLVVWRVVARRLGGPPHELALLLGGFVCVFVGASGLTGHGLPFTRFGIAYGALIALSVCGAVAAAISAADPPVRFLALGLALALVPLPSIAGHALEDGRLRAPELALDIVHVLAASVWLGGIASLLLSLRALEPPVRGRVVERFSSLALDAVVLLAASGIGRALGELKAVHQLWTTSYGVAILVKTGLFGALVAVGFAQRRWLVARGGGAFRRALRLELVLLVAAVGAVAFLTDVRPGRTIVPPQALPAAPIVLPPRDAVVFAARQGDLALGFALRPAGRLTELTLTVVGPLGGGVDGLGATLDLGSRSVILVPCGGGCYRARTVVHPGEPAHLVLRGHGKETRTPLVLPSAAAPSAATLVATVGRRYNALHSVSIGERLSSGRATQRTRYELVAPASFAYRIAGGGPQAIVLGARRWDRTSPRDPWVASPQTPIPQPRIWWGARPQSAHLVGHGHLDGRPVDVVTLVSPDLKAWFEVWIDPVRKLPLQLRMTAAAHFMLHRYSGFDHPVALRPPQ